MAVTRMALALRSIHLDGQLFTMPGAACEDSLINMYIYLCKAGRTWLNSIPYRIAGNISVPKISWFGPKPSVKEIIGKNLNLVVALCSLLCHHEHCVCVY